VIEVRIRLVHLGGGEPLELALARPVPSIAHAAGLPGGTAWEPKWDGVRAVAVADGPATTLLARHHGDVTLAFPEVVAAVAAQVPPGSVLDGELVVRRDGAVDFEAVQRRLGARRAAPDRGATPTRAGYVAFDLLRDARTDARERRFADRRVALERLAHGWAAPLELCPLTGDADLAARWFRDLAGTGVDGLVAKGLDQPYRGGVRDWCKVKHRSVLDLVVTAVTGPVHEPSALLLALPREGELVPVGRSRPLGVVAATALARHLVPAEAGAGRASGVATPVSPLVVEVSAGVGWSRGLLTGPAHYLRARPELDPTEVGQL
jgi:ATP-dependent DNA ligase